MCSNVRVLTAAIAGYLLGGLTGSAVASWLLMVAAGAAMFTWSRVTERRNGGASCALPRDRSREASTSPVFDGPLDLAAPPRTLSEPKRRVDEAVSSLKAD